MRDKHEQECRRINRLLNVGFGVLVVLWIVGMAVLGWAIMTALEWR